MILAFAAARAPASSAGAVVLVALVSATPAGAQGTRRPDPANPESRFQIQVQEPRTSGPPAPAEPRPGDSSPGVSSGLLECRGAMTTAYGFGSTRPVHCEFRPTVGRNHYYAGTLERIGLDFGVSDQASMLWAVLAPSAQIAPGALTGTYVGFTSGFALGPGFSANVLAAKDATKQITLQPVSISADSGLSISLAGATLTLWSAAPEPRR